MSLHENAVAARGLTKRYGDDILAVDGLNLAVRKGEIYALLGPNGAGKTTTVSMLMTLVQPTSGSATVAGHDVIDAPEVVRERIGVTFQEIVLDPALKGREVLTYHGRLYGMSRAECDTQIAALLKLVELEDAADRFVKHYSGGMKRRLELARGLMTHPDVLFLDEPTQGLDPQNRAKVWDYLRALRRDRGLTIPYDDALYGRGRSIGGPRGNHRPGAIGDRGNTDRTCRGDGGRFNPRRRVGGCGAFGDGTRIAGLRRGDHTGRRRSYHRSRCG